jgi:hypothetical protein
LDYREEQGARDCNFLRGSVSDKLHECVRAFAARFEILFKLELARSAANLDRLGHGDTSATCTPTVLNNYHMQGKKSQLRLGLSLGLDTSALKAAQLQAPHSPWRETHFVLWGIVWPRQLRFHIKCFVVWQLECAQRS